MNYKQLNHERLDRVLRGTIAKQNMITTAKAMDKIIFGELAWDFTNMEIKTQSESDKRILHTTNWRYCSCEAFQLEKNCCHRIVFDVLAAYEHTTFDELRKVVA
jgi:predicted phosphohydrolase